MKPGDRVYLTGALPIDGGPWALPPGSVGVVFDPEGAPPAEMVAVRFSGVMGWPADICAWVDTARLAREA